MATHFYKIRLDQSARGREGAVMSDKFDQFEIQKEVSLLLDSLPPSEQRQVMAGLAERYGFKLADKAATTSKGYRPGYGRKRGRLTLRGQQPRRPTSREPQRADTVDAHGLERRPVPLIAFPVRPLPLIAPKLAGAARTARGTPFSAGAALILQTGNCVFPHLWQCALTRPALFSASRAMTL